MELWSLFQEQILGMRWLNEWLGRGLSALGLDIHGRLGGSVQFFLYDSLKITVLLCVLIFSISYIQSYFPPERSKHILGRLHGVGANLVSALLGTVTPFCSCSSIPLFIGFTGAGLPLGVTFSFLISSPMVDLGSLVLLMSIFGTKVAIFYVVVGLALAVAGGTLLERLHMEKHVEQFVFSAGSMDIESPELTRRERVRYAREQAVSTFKKVAPYILVGVGLGAVIHNWIPESWIETVLGGSNPFGVVLAVLVGVPMYADIFGTIPVAEALLAKGAQLGTVLAFMMASLIMLMLPAIFADKIPAQWQQYILLASSVVMYGSFIATAVESFFVWRTIKARFTESHPREDIPRGTGYYTFSRMIMPRRWRSPRPQVERGQFPK